MENIKEEIVKDLEKYDKEGNMEMYDGLYEGLESFSKSFLLSGEITNSQFETILKKYRG